MQVQKSGESLARAMSGGCLLTSLRNTVRMDNNDKNGLSVWCNNCQEFPDKYRLENSDMGVASLTCVQCGEQQQTQGERFENLDYFQITVPSRELSKEEIYNLKCELEDWANSDHDHLSERLEEEPTEK